MRIFHWCLAGGFAVAWFAGEEGETLHFWTDYAIAALIAVRVIWGFMGPRYARFTEYARGSRATFAYLKDSLDGHQLRYIGHDPLAAVMLLTLLITLSGTALTGWLLEDSARLALLPDLSVKPQVGSTVRVWRHDDQHVALYFNGKDMLVENYRSLFADDLLYSKNRAVLFKVSEPLPEALTKQCIRMVLYYHRDKKTRQGLVSHESNVTH